MSKGWQGNFFEDFALDQVIGGTAPRTIGSGEQALYIALTGDRTEAYCGPAQLVHPLVVFHTVFGQTVRAISLNARANLGYANLRFGVAVRLGDTITTEMIVTGLKENSSKTTGVVYVDTVGRNQNGDVVLSYTRWVMIRKRSEAPTRWLEAGVVPTLLSIVPASELALETAQMARGASGSSCYHWDDYAVGERIFHYDGMTVNPSDHMAMTRLFQNSAKVHFDALAMKGTPLVYGGVVISHGYAASLNGLDGRLGIAAINAGQHANPVAAGDTLYAMTEVVDSVETADPHVGALRLKMYVFKNIEPSTLEDAAPWVDDAARPGRKVLRNDVVLELDYWELVRRA